MDREQLVDLIFRYYEARNEKKWVDGQVSALGSDLKGELKPYTSSSPIRVPATGDYPALKAYVQVTKPRESVPVDALRNYLMGLLGDRDKVDAVVEGLIKRGESSERLMVVADEENEDA